LTPFWGVGIGLALAVYEMGRRRAILAVVGDSLLVIQEGPMRLKRSEWHRDELKDVRPAPSGLSVNHKRVLELQIQPKLGKPFGLLGGHGDPELEWIATMLRGALRLPAESVPPANA